MEDFTQEYVRAILLLGITTTIYAFIRIKHKYADESSRWLVGILEGYTLNAGFWTGILVLAIITTQQNAGWILRLVQLVLFTKFLNAVTFIEISSTIISITWGLAEQSRKKLDYRILVVTIFAIFAVILIAYYSTSGLIR
jgi:hypothetical protein